MSSHGPLKTGQEVFLKSPLQIYATVIGPSEIGSDGAEIYPVKLHALKQFYRLEDLERSQRPELRPANCPTNRLDLFAREEEITDLIARRAYELFESSGLTHGHDLQDWIRAKSEILQDVPVDIRETETGLTIRAEVPGFSEETLEVGVVPRALCIAGKRQEPSEQGNAVYSERHADQIFRVLDLPSQVDPNGMNLTLDAGILEIRVPKLRIGEQTTLVAKGATA